MNRGKLIVIEGIDGSGKATQAKKLKESLSQKGYQTETIDFPHYYENLLGGLIGECLAGKHGDYAHMDPKVISVLYAADRFESKSKIEKWLDEGAMVVIDRYTGSNQIHQGGKISDEEERKKFLLWLDKLEYGVFGLPVPDVTIYLDVELAVVNELLKKPSTKKEYAGGQKDAHEADPEHLKNARESAQFVASLGKWKTVQCTSSGSLRAISDIADEVLAITEEIVNESKKEN